MRIKHTSPDKNGTSNLNGLTLFKTSLENVFSNVEGGFTMAITGSWGSGKTTFVNDWVPELRNKGYKVIYLNAWESDFIASPFACLLGELKLALGDLLDEAKMIELSQHVLVEELKTKDSDSSSLVDSLTAVSEASVSQEIANYNELRQTLAKFRDLLQSAVNEKVVFFIDELDRCRPDYAVRLLELVKHFFSVEGIIFVMVIDKKHLCESIKGFYGSPAFDTSDYLRRFFEVEVELPHPSYKEYCEYLSKYYGITEFFSNPNRTYYPVLQGDLEIFLQTATSLATVKRLTFRQIEHLFSYLRIVLLSVEQKGLVFPDILLILLYLKQFVPDRYEQLSGGQAKIADVAILFEEVFSDVLIYITKNSIHYFEYSYVCFLRFYENYFKGDVWGHGDTSIYDPSTKKLLIPSNFISEERIIELIKYYDRTQNSISMKSLFSAINLLHQR